jgi:hypothetical protein
MKLKLRDGSNFELPTNEKQAAKVLADALVSNGRVPGEDALLDYQEVVKYLRPSMKDMVGVSAIRPLLQTAMQIIIREPVEPLMVIQGLFNRVEAKGLETNVLAGAIGAVTAGDIPEHGTYPEVMFQIGGALQTAYIGKSGLAASFTDEALRYSTWDIMAMNLRLMRNALMRHKEQKAVAFLRQLGTELFNNASPSTSLFGVTTGRGLNMAANGTVIMDDLVKAMAHMTEEGSTPDILLVHPILFLQWLQDPVMRNMFVGGAGGSYFGSYSGNPGPVAPWSNGPLGSMGPRLGQQVTPFDNTSGESPDYAINERAHGMTSAPILPGYFPWPLRIMPSALVPFDETAGLTDMFLLESGNIGFMLVDEDLTQVEWRDENVDVVKVKLRERYGFGVANEGQSVGVLKNIKLGRNYWDGVIRAQTSDVTDEIDSSVAVV